MAPNDDAAAGRDRRLVESALAGVKGERREFAPSAERWNLDEYEPICMVHRGGQGVVFRAVQRSTGRHVAIKMLRHGDLSTPTELARLQREAMILGQLRHPHIVTIFDRGEVNGAPYLVMDFIDGRPLNHWLADERPTLKDTLRLFTTIADAVQAAHLLGVVHRDLKPANILVDEEGEPHVVDFGLAKDPIAAGASAGVTRTGQFSGTVPWSAPEQVTGKGGGTDVRADVYSLGVLLHQALTDEFPYEVSGGFQDIASRIVNAVPRRPSERRHGIDDDLDTIVLRCLAKEPERRYQSAGELARDLRRYLNGDAIEAKRDSHWYVLSKSFKRHRIPVAAATVVLLVTGLGLVASLVSLRRAERELARATELRRVLFAVFSGVDPETARGRDTTLLRELMGRVESNLGTGGDELVEADARNALGLVYLGIDDLDVADAQFSRSLDIRRRALGKDHPGTLDTLHHLGKLRIAQQRWEEAEAVLRESLAQSERAFGESHMHTLNCVSDLALVLRELGQLDESLPLIERAVTGYRRVLGDDHRDTLAAMINAGMQYRLTGRFAEAEVMYREALNGLLRTLGEDYPDTAACLNNLGALMNAMERPGEGEGFHRRALELRRRTLGPEHALTIGSVNNLASTWILLNRNDEARSLLEEYLPIAREKWAGTGNLGLFLNKVATVQTRANHYREAEATLHEALSLLVAQYGENHRQTRKTYECLAELYTEWHKASLDPEHERQSHSWREKADAAVK